MTWVLIYNSVEANLQGRDRQNAIACMDDDVAFDKWMKAFDRQRALQEAELDNARSNRGSRNSQGMVKVDKEQYLKHAKKEYGADNLPY